MLSIRAWGVVALLPFACLGCGGGSSVSMPTTESIRQSVADAGSSIQKGATQAGAAIQEAAAEVPVPEELREIHEQLAPLFTSLGDVLGSIRDKETAESALPKFQEISEKIDLVKPIADKLPKPARKALNALIGGRVGRIKDKIDTVLEIKEVAETLKPVLTTIVKKLQGLMD